MPVTSADIVVYGSATMAEDDTTSPVGGAIDTSTIVVFTDIGATAGAVGVVSDNTGDTGTVTVTGRDSTGVIQSETLTLSGTTKVTGTQTFERILKIVAATHSGTITVTDEANGAATIATMDPTVNTVRRPFYDVSADVAGGSTRVFYEKIFVKNNNTTTALTNAQIEEVAGGAADNIAFALESSLDGTGTATNRVTAPGSGVTAFDSTAKLVNGGNHSPGSAQGVWLELTLAAGTPANKTTYTIRETGTSV